MHNKKINIECDVDEGESLFFFPQLAVMQGGNVGSCHVLNLTVSQVFTAGRGFNRDATWRVHSKIIIEPHPLSHDQSNVCNHFFEYK